MKAALYHRVSTTDQNPTLAREELRAAARARGLEVALEVEETGSGARNDRPGLQQVLRAARRHEVGAVLVWKLDRWGRSMLDCMGNIDSLRRCGCAWIAVSQGIEVRPGGDASSGLVVGVLAAVAEWEREVIRERTRLGLDGARRRGVRLGRPRTGPDPAAVRQLRDPERPGGRLSWAQVAAALGCSESGARRAAARTTDDERSDP